MIIGIDGRPFAIPFPCGVKHYAQNLIFNLLTLDRTNSYIIYASKKIQIPTGKNVRVHYLPSHVPFFRQQLIMPYLVKKDHVDVFHYLEPYGCVFLSHPHIVTTVHDINLNAVIPTFRNVRMFARRLYIECMRNSIISNTKLYICVSHAVKHELHRTFPYVTQRLTQTIYEGIGDVFLKEKTVKKKQNYFLCFSDFSPRKNTPRILAAFEILARAVPGRYQLKIIVSSTLPRQDIECEIQKYALKKSDYELIFTPTSEHIAELYRHAAALLYPSLYEGFGLPVLEAMASGCPVITSRFGATKEIADSAALFVDPYSVHSIYDALKKITESTYTSEEYMRHGLERSSRFSWQQTAKQTLRCYERAVNKI